MSSHPLTPRINSIEDNAGQVGDVVDSILDEATIQSKRGPGWVLMDGRNIEGTELAQLTGWTTLPDARGIFRRAKNNGRSDGNQNPDGEVAIGTIGIDKTRRPRDSSLSGSTNTTGNHRHNHNAVWNAGTGGGGGRLQNFDSSMSDPTGIAQAGNHSHTATISSGGDAETRPTNITVNTYIRID
jgi:hypothetical protein